MNTGSKKLQREVGSTFCGAHGLLLFSGFFVPLALTVLAAELYNILAFHLTMAPGSIAPALVACVLWILVFLQYRESFKGIFSAKPATQP